jgi:Iron dependent repressor, N-terminal DNA binding domain
MAKRVDNGQDGRRREFAPGTFALAVASSGNKKIGNSATTYAAQTSCPTSCPFFDGGGCYAEGGSLGRFVTAPLNRAAQVVDHDLVDVAKAEAAAIDNLKVKPGRPLRLHTVGDCASDEAARIVATAAARYRARGGGPVWTYTHAWRDVARESWGEVSVLASCETYADVELAKKRGYATSSVVKHFREKRRHLVDANESRPLVGVDILPCPEQTSGTKCEKCRLCFDDERLREVGYTIAFAEHGDAFTRRQIRKACDTPDDPDRKRTSRQRIPETIAELETEGTKVTNVEIGRRIGISPSSVAQMRKRLAEEAAERGD